MQKIKNVNGHIKLSDKEKIDLKTWLKTLTSYSGKVEINILSREGNVTDTTIFNIETFSADESVFDYTYSSFYADTDSITREVVAIAKIINVE